MLYSLILDGKNNKRRKEGYVKMYLTSGLEDETFLKQSTIFLIKDTGEIPEENFKEIKDIIDRNENMGMH